jgi:hypothetical protein
MRTWEKPKLIVLVRSKPEESLILYCKFSSGIQGTGSPTDLFFGCYNQLGLCNGECSITNVS